MGRQRTAAEAARLRADIAAMLGQPRRAIAEALGISVAMVAYYQGQRDEAPALIVGGMRCPPEMRRLLGTMPDAEVARRVGYSREHVCRVRRALGIPAEYGRKTRAAASVARLQARRAQWVVTTHGGVLDPRDIRHLVHADRARGWTFQRIRVERGVSQGVIDDHTLPRRSRSPVYDGLCELLRHHGPLTEREIDDLWRPRSFRWLGWYRARGWLVRDGEGRYHLPTAAK